MFNIIIIEPVLELYFSNEAKCGGGNIAEILVKNDEAYITYAEPEGIIMITVAAVIEVRYVTGPAKINHYT